MSERMKALPFVVYELFTKNCKKCRIETLPISVSNFQFLIQGKENLDQEGDGQETQKVRLFVNCIKHYFQTNFCSKFVL